MKKKLGVKEELMISVAVILVGIIGWYFALYQPVIKTTSAIEGEIAGLQDSINAIRQYQVMTAGLLTQISDLEELIKVWDSRFPPRSEIVTLAKEIIAFAEHHDLQLMELSPSLFELYALERGGASVSGKYVMQLPLNFKFLGRYINLGKMLGDLDSLPFNLSVAEVEITPADGSYPSIVAKVKLFLYVHH